MNEFHVDPNFRHQSNGLSREQVRNARNFAQRQGQNANTLEHPAGHTPPQDAMIERALLEAITAQTQFCKALALKAGVPEESLVVCTYGCKQLHTKDMSFRSPSYSGLVHL